jgi:hypothetical protein
MLPISKEAAQVVAMPTMQTAEGIMMVMSSAKQLRNDAK